MFAFVVFAMFIAFAVVDAFSSPAWAQTQEVVPLLSAKRILITAGFDRVLPESRAADSRVSFNLNYAFQHLSFGVGRAYYLTEKKGETVFGARLALYRNGKLFGGGS